MPIIRVSHPLARILEMFFSFVFGLIGLILAFDIQVTRIESTFLIIASIVQFYILRKIFRNEIRLHGWSLPYLAWGVAAVYIMWIVGKYH